MDQISVAYAQRLAVASSDIDKLNRQKKEIEQKKRQFDS